jgi:hypothetical protein
MAADARQCLPSCTRVREVGANAAAAVILRFVFFDAIRHAQRLSHRDSHNQNLTNSKKEPHQKTLLRLDSRHPLQYLANTGCNIAFLKEKICPGLTYMVSMEKFGSQNGTQPTASINVPTATNARCAVTTAVHDAYAEKHI